MKIHCGHLLLALLFRIVTGFVRVKTTTPTTSSCSLLQRNSAPPASSYFGAPQEGTVASQTPFAPAGPGATPVWSPRQPLRVDEDSVTEPSVHTWMSPHPEGFLSDVIPVRVQGGSLRTWSFPPKVRMERVHISMATPDGRPLTSNIELWQGPENTPQKMAIYVEDGKLRPFQAIIETPLSVDISNSIAIRNTATMEFPLDAYVKGDVAESFSTHTGPSSPLQIMPMTVIQGGAIRTFPFGHAVESIHIRIETHGRPLNARIELLQGPNNNKQIMEVYTENGGERPFSAIVETPGLGNVVRIVNTATMEFPISASVEPYVIM